MVGVTVVATVFLFIYLTAALLRPEWFEISPLERRL